MGAPPEVEEADPESAAAGINTTRTNISHAGVTDAGGGSGDVPGASQPGMAAGSIITTRSNIKSGVAGMTGEPIPGLDT